ncbi:CHAT domain-containing protein [Moorena bouillonii]|uniref:CHAT domain-containing protein n=1 Tax=Moorena bouillonii TaxID=207920 RepID=UPI001E4DC629|nr:CHAT domain-containing protein [Moorena bouillonii]
MTIFRFDDQTAIVQFYITRDKLVTFITYKTQKPIVWQSQPKDLNKFEKWVHGYLRAYKTNKDHWKRRLATRLHLLAQILHIDEIIQQIPPECDRLILIPYGDLHWFPLHALPITSQQEKAKSEILMDRFPAGVSYAPTLKLLQLAQTRKRPNFTHLFAVQNPTGNLPCTDIEVETIKHYFNQPPDTEVLVGKAATKAAIDSKPLNTYHCVHFSCHGYFNFQEPRKSALILADAYLSPTPAELNQEQHVVLDNGKVIDLDKCFPTNTVSGLELEQCRLVTLSACETGLMPSKSSGDYFNLTSCFLVAGSPAVVSSLSKVDDLSTALLMIKFYQNLFDQNLREQMSLAVALNQAQFWLRDSTQSKLLAWSRQLPLENSLMNKIEQKLRWFNPHQQPFKKPYYWTPFCVIGE